MGNAVIQLALLIAAFGFYSWLSDKGEAEKMNAEARLQEAKNASQGGGNGEG